MSKSVGVIAIANKRDTSKITSQDASIHALFLDSIETLGKWQVTLRILHALFIPASMDAGPYCGLALYKQPALYGYKGMKCEK